MDEKTYRQIIDALQVKKMKPTIANERYREGYNDALLRAASIVHNVYTQQKYKTGEDRD